MVELIKDLIGLHDFIDFLLFLFNLNALVHDEVLVIRQIFNRLGCLHDFVLHEAESGSQLNSAVLGNSGNQLGVLLTNHLVFERVSGTNLLAVDEEHADLDLHWDALKEFLLILHLPEDVVANLLRSGSSLTLTLFSELSHVLVGV
jgi:hypothetical protein